jgi:hypothetical protein
MDQAYRDEREREEVERVYESDDPGAEITYVLTIDGEPYTDLAREITSGRESDSEPGQVLTAQIAEPISRWAKGAETRLELIVGGVARRRFTGKVLTARFREGFTEITCVTGGHYNGKVLLMERVEYDRERPDEVLVDAILRNQAYDHTFTEVLPIPNPRITRSLLPAYADGFTHLDTVGDILQSVGEETQLFQVDNFFNGYTARKDVGPARLMELDATYYVGTTVKSMINPDEFEWTPTEEEYWGVLAYRELEEGTSGATGAGEIEIVARVRISDSSAPPNAWFPIAISNDQSDAEATMLAFDAAARLEHSGGGLYETTFPLPFVDSRISDGACILIVQPDVDGDDPVVRFFRAEIYTQKPSLPEQIHEVSAKAVIEREEEIPEPPVDEEPEARIVSPGMYTDHRGIFRMDTTLPWVEDMGEFVRINVTLAQEMGVDIEEFDEFLRIPT